LEHGVRADRVALCPRELEAARPIAQAAVPALCERRGDTFVVVVDQAVKQAVTVFLGEQGPLILCLLGAQRVGVGEDAGELTAECILAAEPSGEWSESA